MLAANSQGARARAVAPEAPIGIPTESAARGECGSELVYVPAGEVLLGEDGERASGHRITVDGFWIDRHEVTNRQFTRFVQSTGHRTRAELEGWSAVFTAPRTHTDEVPMNSWWRAVKGASWRHPNGPDDTIDERMDYPVVHVTYEDGLAYARWAERTLPDEAQWERAARADQTHSRSPLSWAYNERGAPLANTWQGDFPVESRATDGHEGLAPVMSYSPNAFSVYDMIGNVWEWTRSTPAEGGPERSLRLIKGGSFLCAKDFCANFRPAAWQAQEQDLGASHIGFRTVDADGASPASSAAPGSIRCASK